LACLLHACFNHTKMLSQCFTIPVCVNQAILAATLYRHFMNLEYLGFCFRSLAPRKIGWLHSSFQHLTNVVTLEVAYLDFSLKLQPSVHALLVMTAFDPCLINIWSAHAPCPASPIGILLLRNLSPVHRQPVDHEPPVSETYNISSRQATSGIRLSRNINSLYAPTVMPLPASFLLHRKAGEYLLEVNGVARYCTSFTWGFAQALTIYRQHSQG
jgi:hypothetical protein